MDKKHFNFGSSIRDWYTQAFPDDGLGRHIDPDATFAGAVKFMAGGGDVYEYLGVGDSWVRENVFSKIAAITGAEYDDVRDVWLNHDASECSRLVFLGDHPDCAVDPDWREGFDDVLGPAEQARYDELLAEEEHRKAGLFDSIMAVNEIPLDKVRWDDPVALANGIAAAKLAEKIDGPSAETGERIALFNKELKRIHNEPLRKQLEQIESQVDDLTVKASIYDEMRQIGEHTDPEDIRAVESSVSMTGALMAAAMASYDLSCGLVDDKHIERYDNVITALEERMGFGAGMLSVQTEVGELVASPFAGGISVDINLPDGKGSGQLAFIEATPAELQDDYPTPVHVFTYDGRDSEPVHRTNVHLDGDAMTLDPVKGTPAHNGAQAHGGDRHPADLAKAASAAANRTAGSHTDEAGGIKH